MWQAGFSDHIERILAPTSAAGLGKGSGSTTMRYGRPLSDNVATFRAAQFCIQIQAKNLAPLLTF